MHSPSPPATASAPARAPAMTYRQGILRGRRPAFLRSHADVNFAAHAGVGELGTWRSLRCFPTGSHRDRVVSQENGEPAMNMPCKLLAAAVLAAGAASFAAPAGAAPIAAPSSLHNAAAPALETVQWRRGWRGGGWAPAAVAGAIVGGAIAATQPWNYGYYDGYAYAPGSSATGMIMRRATPMGPRATTTTPTRPATRPALPIAAATPTPIARSASARTIRPRAPIWATTAGVIPVRDANLPRHRGRVLTAVRLRRTANCGPSFSMPASANRA